VVAALRLARERRFTVQSQGASGIKLFSDANAEPVARRPAKAFIRIALGALFLSACSQKNTEGPQSAPLPSLGVDRVLTDGSTADEREALFKVEPALPWGDELPKSLQRVRIEAASISIGERKVNRAESWSRTVLQALGGGECAVLLESDPERYLADLSESLALLANADCEVWIRHPDAPVGFKVKLRDNGQFERWLKEPKPGKIRVIQRADGLELQTSVGKMAGVDPNGPTVPTRGGQLDIARLRRGLERLKERFSNAPDSCLVPSYGTELRSIARALSGYYRGQGERIFDELCLVYPSAPAPSAAMPR
jgi:hypothetical protein